MKRLPLLLLVAGCSGAASPAPNDRVIMTGFPGKPGVVLCDSGGRWGVGSAGIEHWIFDPREKKEHDPSNGGAKMSIFRDSLPFPQFSWGTGDFEVTQLVFPVGDGFMARYHVMNHGEEPREVRLLVGRHDKSGTLPPLVSAGKPSETSASHVAFDLKIEAGASQFVILSTPGAEGRDPNDALDEAVAAWEKIMVRPITITDAQAQSAYCLDLAGRALGHAGCAESARKFEERFVRKDGESIRLLADVPDEWMLETIEVKGLKTDFGAISFKHAGFYNNRTLDLEPGCAPPGGFLMPVGPKHKARIDGKPAESKDGLLRIPAGTKRVELDRPH
jgi:hypothetical protein